MKGGGQQSVSQTVDPRTAQYVDYARRLAMGYTGSGPGNYGGGDPILRNLPPEVQAAQQQYGQYARGGNLGFSALTGDAGAAAQFQNPYLSAMNPFFAQQRQQAIEQANQQATLAGAFGGDRSQIGAAVAGSQADQTQAGFNYQAFQDAMQRAAQAANLGFGAIGAGAFLPQAYQSGQLNLLNQALGPHGQTQTQQSHSDLFSQLLGLGATAGGLFLGRPSSGGGLFSYPDAGQGFGPATPGQVW